VTAPAPVLLVVSHSRTGNTGRLVDALLEGTDEALHGLTTAPGADTRPEVRHLGCFEAGSDDVLRAGALALATPANFGYMSGAMKDFFERIYHPCLEHTRGRPYVLLVKGDTDTAGAVSSVERIVAGLEWKMVLPVLEVTGALRPEHLEQAHEIGATLAAGLADGLF
jgi:multimeric flavodoxin WrbA